MKKFYPHIFFLFSIILASASIPKVSNISYSQRIDQNGSPTKLVDIQYDLDGNRSMYVEFFFSHDGGLSFPIICSAMSGDAGVGIQSGTFKNATWDASVDWDKSFTEQGRIMIKATYSDQPTGFPGLDGNGSFQEPFHVVELNSSINLEMIWVEPGTFTMGSPASEADRNPDENETQVTLDSGFYLGKFEVTQPQYKAVMLGNDNNLSSTPSQHGFNPMRPVEMVSWEDVQIFLERLNAQEANNLLPGWEYILPSEVQWEYACRAGTHTTYHWGNDINSSFANYNLNIGKTTEVGSFGANPWGFYDMHGNVLEFTTVSGLPTNLPLFNPSNPESFIKLFVSYDDNNFTPGQVRVPENMDPYLHGPLGNDSTGIYIPSSNWGLSEWNPSYPWQSGQRVLDTVTERIYEMGSKVKGAFIGQATAPGDLVLYDGNWFEATSTNAGADIPGISGYWSGGPNGTGVDILSLGGIDKTVEYIDLANTSAWSRIQYGSAAGKIIKGGGWNSQKSDLRSAQRNNYSVDLRNDSIGFRVSLQKTQ